MRSIKKIKSVLMKLWLNNLPDKSKHVFYRKLLRIPKQVDEGIIFKIADTREELSSAFHLLHNEYVKSGYMTPHESLMRLTIYHALPSTTTLVAKKGDVVIGTVSVISDNKFGLPLEKIFDTSATRGDDEHIKVCEISALAINRDYNKQRGEINLPLTKFLFEYVKYYLKCNIMVIAVNPDWVDYYKSIWDFQPLPKTDVVESYSYVQGAPAVGLFLNLDTCKENLTSIYYNHFNPEQDFYSFLFKTKLDNYQFPDRSFKTVSDPVMTPELLNYFFNKCSNTFKSLSEEEKVQLRFLYLNLHNFADILPQVESNEIKSKEEREIFQKVREIRFEANCKGAIFVKVDNVITFQPLQILDVSENGIAFKSKGEVPTGLEVELRADVGYLTVSKLLVKVCHTGEDFHYGAQIINSDSYWREFLDYLQNNLTREDDIEDDKKVA